MCRLYLFNPDKNKSATLLNKCTAVQVALVRLSRGLSDRSLLFNLYKKLNHISHYGFEWFDRGEPKQPLGF